MGRIYRAVSISYDSKKEIAIALVDTGADETVISEKLARKLNAKLYGTFLARCASQTILKGKFANISVKELKSGKESMLKVGVSDIPFDTDDINEDGVDIILGVDFIQKVGLMEMWDEWDDYKI